MIGKNTLISDFGAQASFEGGIAPVNIHLSNVNCRGTEQSLLQCDFNRQQYNCDHSHDVGIHCQPSESAHAL